MTDPSRSSGTTSGGMQTGKAILVIAVVVLLGWVVLRHGSSNPTHTSSAAAAPTTTTTRPAVVAPVTTPPTTVALVSPASIKLQVLNGVLTGSLAGQWSTKLKANPGYQTMPPLNATARVAQSVIYVVTPGYQPEADALAAAVGLPATAVSPVTPPPATAPIPGGIAATANLVLVIGPDLAGSA